MKFKEIEKCHIIKVSLPYFNYYMIPKRKLLRKNSAYFWKLNKKINWILLFDKRQNPNVKEVFCFIFIKIVSYIFYWKIKVKEKCLLQSQIFKVSIFFFMNRFASLASWKLPGGFLVGFLEASLFILLLIDRAKQNPTT